MIYTIAKSVIVTASISSVFGFFLTHFNIPFFKSFLLSIAVQIALWQIYLHYTDIKTAITVKQLNNELAKEITTQTTVLECAYCKSHNNVIVKLDKPIQFNCDACNKLNSVYVTFEAVQKAQSQ